MQTCHIMIDADGREKTRHGEYSFPLAVYTTEIRRNVLGFVDWHWHEELQLCLVIRGTVAFSIHENTLVLKEGEGIFINREQLHRAANHDSCDGVYICLDFQAQLLSGFEGSAAEVKYVTPYIENEAIAYVVLHPDISWQSSVLEAIRSIYKAYEEKSLAYELGVSIELLRIWQYLVTYSFSSFPEQGRNGDRVSCKEIIGYVSAHYGEKIVLSDLASAISLSEGTCCRIFKKAMKCTIFEYIINYRLTKSAALLLATTESVNAIAYQCGFSNASYYISQFKKKTHLTPQEYRKQPGM